MDGHVGGWILQRILCGCEPIRFKIVIGGFWSVVFARQPSPSYQCQPLKLLANRSAFLSVYHPPSNTFNPETVPSHAGSRPHSPILNRSGEHGGVALGGRGAAALSPRGTPASGAAPIITIISIIASIILGTSLPALFWAFLSWTGVARSPAPRSIARTE